MKIFRILICTFVLAMALFSESSLFAGGHHGGGRHGGRGWGRGWRGGWYPSYAYMDGAWGYYDQDGYWVVDPDYVEPRAGISVGVGPVNVGFGIGYHRRLRRRYW